MEGVDCTLDSHAPEETRFTIKPVNVEVLLTMSKLSLLETETPKHATVVEISPVQVVLSEHRLNLLQAAKASLDLNALYTRSELRKLKQRKPDPPRIEILSQRILHAIDLSCKKVDVLIEKDEEQENSLSLKYKEIVMEESLSDFLSFVACFDFSLPNEEAISSAMQVCIGRLVGLGLTDDEAWECTNAARLNFLEGISGMRQAQNDTLVQFSAGIRSSQLLKTKVEEETEDNMSASASLVGNDDSGMQTSEQERNPLSSGEAMFLSSVMVEDVSDDDSANSADVVETTFKNAVEKTVATFSSLLREYPGRDASKGVVLAFNLPYGLRTSLVRLFYDQYLTLVVTSVVVTNSAGIELVTLVPISESDSGQDKVKKSVPQGISFSRFDLDKGYEFGSGGLGMSVLASDEGAECDTFFRERSRFDDIEIGEIEFLFASNILEAVVDDVSNLGKGPASSEGGSGDKFEAMIHPVRCRG